MLQNYIDVKSLLYKKRFARIFTYFYERAQYLPFFCSIHIEYGLQIQCTNSHLTSLRDKTTTTARLNRTHELLDNSRPTGLTYAAYIRLSQKSSASHM